MTNDILTNTAREYTEANLTLLREDIRDRMTNAVQNLLTVSTPARIFEDHRNDARLIEKAAAVALVNQVLGEQLAAVQTVEEAHDHIDTIETWGMTAVSDGFRQGCMLVVGYINEYLR